MTYKVADRVKETTVVTGTGPATLLGAASGYRSFGSQLSIGDTCAYAIVNANASEWEVGIGTYSASNTLTRTTVHSSTNSDNLVNFSSGVKDVFLGPTADSFPAYDPVTQTISNTTWNGSTIATSKGGTGLTSIGSANQVLAVNSTGDGLEYHTIVPNPGTVTSVSGTGSVNGITLTGTVTSSGNLTLGGTLSNVDLTTQVTNTLPVLHGGTGLTSIGSSNQALAVNSAGTGLEYHNVVGSVTSADGTVTLNQTGTNVDLSVAVAAATTNVIVQVRNNTGATLTKGTVVYINNAIGQIPTVAKALATSDATSAQTLGMVSADINDNANGYVTIIGLINDINTGSYLDGDQLYLSGTTAGTFTKVKPYAPTHLVYVGVVEYAHSVHGKIFVKVQNGYEMDELHNVDAYNPSNGDLLIYNNTTNLWAHSPQSSLTVAPSQVTGTAVITTDSRLSDSRTPTGSAGGVLSGTYPNPSFASTTGSGAVVLSTAPTLTTATFAAGTISTSTPNTITQTWNNAAVAFSALTENITDNASASASLLVDLQVGGVSKFAVRKDGTPFFTANIAAIPAVSSLTWYGNTGATTAMCAMTTGSFTISSNSFFGWTGRNSGIYQPVDHTYEYRGGTNPQSFRVYNTYTDASNYERLGITWASNICTIGLAQAGTGLPRTLNVNANALNAPSLPSAATVTAASSNGTTVTYTAANTFSVGQSVAITGFTTSTYNITGAITSASATQFTLATVAGSPPSGTATGTGTATIQSAGNSVTITAGSGSGVGAGGNIILQPGAQGTSGGNGTIVLKDTGGTSRGTIDPATNITMTCTSGSWIFSVSGGTALTIFNNKLFQFASGGSFAGNISTTAGVSAGQAGFYGNTANIFDVAGNSFGDTLVALRLRGTTPELRFGATSDLGIKRNTAGVATFTDASTGGGSLSFPSATTAIAANSNDLVLSGSAFQRLTSNAAYSITGIAPPTGGTHVDGRIIEVYNTNTSTSYNLTFSHNNTSSAIANRFYNATGADIIIGKNDYVRLIYDATDNGSGAAGWRVS